MTEGKRDPLSEAAAAAEDRAKRNKGVVVSVSTIPHDGRTKLKVTTDENAEATPVTHGKNAGQARSTTGFPKGTVGTGGSWTPD